MLVRLDAPADGPANMAADVALLESAEGGALGARVYAWTGAWVTLGRHQRAETALAPGCTVPWVVRPTGGKAVLHGHDVTVGLAVPLALLGLPDGSRRLGDVYRAVVAPLVGALADCGVPATLAEDTPFVRSVGKVADCFAHVAPNDVVGPDGGKVCGCALKLTAQAVLLQASVPAGPPLVDLATVYTAPARERWSWLEAPTFRAALEGRLAPLTARA